MGASLCSVDRSPVLLRISRPGATSLLLQGLERFHAQHYRIRHFLDLLNSAVTSMPLSSRASTSTLPTLPSLYTLLFGHLLGVGLEIDLFVLRVDLARLMIVFVWEILPITDPASVMFPPVFLEGERRIANPERRIPHSSMGWYSPPLRLVLPMLLRVVRHKRKVMRFLVILSGPTLAPGIFRTPAAIISHLSMMSVFAAIMVPMIVMVFNMRFIFGVELPFDTQVLDG